MSMKITKYAVIHPITKDTFTKVAVFWSEAEARAWMTRNYANVDYPLVVVPVVYDTVVTELTSTDPTGQKNNSCVLVCKPREL